MKKILKMLAVIFCTGAVSVNVSAKTETVYITNPTEISVGEDAVWETKSSNNVKIDMKKEYRFTEDMAGKTIPVTIGENGTLSIDRQYDISFYDKTNKKLEIPRKNEWDGASYLANVKKGEVYYCKIPSDFKLNNADEKYMFLSMYVMPDKGDELVQRDGQILVGNDKSEYKYFSVKKKSLVKLTMIPTIVDYKSHVTASVQKKQNGKWKTVIKNLNTKADEHGKWAYDVGLTKGKYRLKIQVPKGQFAAMYYDTESVKKVAVKLKKAKKLQKGKEVKNIILRDDNKAHYYKIKVSSKKCKLNIKTDINTGKVKISVYANGKSKPVDALSMKKSNDYDYVSGYEEKTINLGKYKGTVYVKVEKTRKNSNGTYRLSFNNK